MFALNVKETIWLKHNIATKISKLGEFWQLALTFSFTKGGVPCPSGYTSTRTHRLDRSANVSTIFRGASKDGRMGAVTLGWWGGLGSWSLLAYCWAQVKITEVSLLTSQRVPKSERSKLSGVEGRKTLKIYLKMTFKYQKINTIELKKVISTISYS